MTNRTFDENNPPSICSNITDAIISTSKAFYKNIKSLSSANNTLSYGAISEEQKTERNKTALEWLAESCAGFGKTIGADKAGTSFGKFVQTLPSYPIPSIVPSHLRPNTDSIGKNLRNLAGRDSKGNITTITESLGNNFSLALSSASEKFYKIGRVEAISSFATKLENDMKARTSTKVILTVGKIIQAVVVTTPIKLVSFAAKSAYHIVKGTEKGVRTIRTSALDTYQVLTKKTNTELIGRSIAFLGYGLFAASYIGTHSAAAFAGLFVYHELKASLAIRTVFGAVDGALHGEITAAAFMPEGGDFTKTTLAHRIGLGAIGAVVGAFNFSVGSVSAGEAFEIGLTGKLVILTGMCLTSLITSPMISFGEGIIATIPQPDTDTLENNPKPHPALDNLFYKDDIKEITLNCGHWIREQISDLGKPISEIRELWTSPKTPQAS